MCLSAVKRILKAERAALHGGVNSVRNKIIVTLASTYNADVRNGKLEDFSSLFYFKFFGTKFIKICLNFFRHSSICG